MGPAPVLSVFARWLLVSRGARLSGAHRGCEVPRTGKFSLRDRTHPFRDRRRAPGRRAEDENRFVGEMPLGLASSGHETIRVAGPPSTKISSMEPAGRALADPAPAGQVHRHTGLRFPPDFPDTPA
jgi:hypothetical protein